MKTAKGLPFPNFDTRINHLFEELTREWDVSSSGRPGKEVNVFNPSLNLVEKETTFEVSVALPGIDEKEIQISLEEGVLTITLRYRLTLSFGSI